MAEKSSIVPVTYLVASTATAAHGEHKMAYLTDESDLKTLTVDELGDEQESFIDETEFEESAIVAIQCQFPQVAAEFGIETVSQNGAVTIHVEYFEAGIHAPGYHLLLIRITPEDDIPDDVTVVLENDPHNDYESTVFGTTDGGRLTTDP